LNKAWCKLNMKWTRITTCVNKLEKCYPLDLYLYFFRFHWIWLMYDVMKKEWWPRWWNKVLSQKLWKWRFGDQKPFPPTKTIWTIQERDMPSWKENGERKVGMRGENVRGIRKYCWFFNIYTIWSNEPLQISHFILIKFCLIFILSIFAFDDDNRKTPKQSNKQTIIKKTT
jgi:hypothetical protein